MKQIQSAVSTIFVGFLAKPLSTETETRVESGIWGIGKGPEKKSERERHFIGKWSSSRLIVSLWRARSGSEELSTLGLFC